MSDQFSGYPGISPIEKILLTNYTKANDNTTDFGTILRVRYQDQINYSTSLFLKLNGGLFPSHGGI
jgi:hypothetical protein